MSITNDRIWTYRPDASGVLELGTLASNPSSCEVIDLSGGEEEQWWAGRVACLGGCRRHIYLALVNLPSAEIPTGLMCPRCKNERAVPELHWGNSYRVTCLCGRATHQIRVEPGKADIERQCRRCGHYTTRAERWPYPS